MGNRGLLGCLIAIVVIVAICGIWLASTYNNLVSLSQAVDAQWGQVENVYQRRADLIPNLVETVKGVANFEKSTYIAVADARAKVGQLNLPNDASVTTNPENFQKFQAAQDGLSSALTRLLAVVENYPQLKANENFLTLQSQLEGTENRIGSSACATIKRRKRSTPRASNSRPCSSSGCSARSSASGSISRRNRARKPLRK